MYQLKAFSTNELLIDNFIRSVASVGELSSYATTYVREKQYYSSSEFPELQLCVFSSTNNSGYIEAPSNIRDMILKISDWVYSTATEGSTGVDLDQYQESFVSFWGDDLVLEEVGELVQKYYQNSLKVYPSYLVFSFKTLINEDNVIRLWFSSAAFESQFDLYEVLPVDIVDDLDLFFTGYTNVKALMDAIVFSDILEASEVIADKYPYTKQRADQFDYVNPINPTQKIPVYWPTLIYGIYGDNLQVVKETLVEHILENSSHTREEWAQLFPELFSTTEFMIVPMFNHYAIPNLTTQSGLYRACISVADATDTAKKAIKGLGYTQEYILNNLSIMGTLYKSITLLSVGGAQNLNGVNRLENQFKDLILVPSTHPDFQRMSKTTREFVIFLTNLIVEAEKATPYNTISTDVIRITREGLLYVSAAYKRIQYYVLTKHSLGNSALGFIGRS